MKLTIIRGIPRSGKSTYAKANYNCLILEQDMYFQKNGKYSWHGSEMDGAVEWCKKMCRMNLPYMDVCVVNTFCKHAYIQDYEQIAAECGAEFEVIHVDKHFSNIHNVPPNVLENMKKSFVPWPGEKVVS